MKENSSIEVCFKISWGTFLSITFIVWTTVSILKYNEEPTSTEIWSTVGDGQLETEKLHKFFPETFKSDVSLGRNGIYFPQLTICNFNFVKDNTILSKCGNGSHNFVQALSNCLETDPNFAIEDLKKSLQTDHRIFIETPQLFYGTQNIISLKHLDDIIWSNVYHRRFGLCYKLDLSDIVSHDQDSFNCSKNQLRYPKILFT